MALAMLVINLEPAVRDSEASCYRDRLWRERMSGIPPICGAHSEKDSGLARGSTGRPTITRATAPVDAMRGTYCAYSRTPAPRSNVRSMDGAVCSRRRAHT